MLVKTAVKEADEQSEMKTRTHFAHRIELLNAVGEIQEHLAGMEDYPPKADTGCASHRPTSCKVSGISTA